MREDIIDFIGENYAKLICEQYNLDNSLKDILKKVYKSGIEDAEKRYKTRLDGKISLLQAWLLTNFRNLEFNPFTKGEIIVNNNDSNIKYRIEYSMGDFYDVTEYPKQVSSKKIRINKDELETNFHHLPSYIGEAL